MLESPYILIGKLLKTFGTEGHLRAKISDPFLRFLRKDQVVRVSVNGIPVPLKLRKISEHHKPLLKFHDTDTENKARNFTGCWLYLHPDDHPKLIDLPDSKESEPWHFLVGYKVDFIHYKVVGRVREVRLYPGQWMAFIEESDNNILHLIPLVDEFISKIDRSSNKITFDVPEGLLSL